MALPAAFIDDMKQVLPASELEAFLRALTDGEQPTSIRLNPGKTYGIAPTSGPETMSGATPVAWCSTGRYLNTRPQFTLDPLLHAGAYYVQEASSQFIAHVVGQLPIVHSQQSTVRCLDLCASPGGKSTAVLSALPEGSVLVSNEIDRKRARILAENIQKWGNPNVCVTANAPADFKALRQTFDLIITDVPCSGEGMFRKDAGAIAEWNPAKVRECASLQRQIVTDIWPCLRPGGWLIYSTCTFNVHEDEENLQYIHDALGGEVVPIPTEPEWHIHPALTGNFAPDIRQESACRFMPHYTRGEGLFMALVHKPEEQENSVSNKSKMTNTSRRSALTTNWVEGEGTVEQDADGTLRFIPATLAEMHQLLVRNRLYLLSAGVELGIQKGKDLQPAHALSLSTALRRGTFPEVDLDLTTALNYLRREAIVLPADTPRGYVLLTYRNLPLGFVKNIGNRCNSLYPTEWRIRNL